jgi:hypothetical protein
MWISLTATCEDNPTTKDHDVVAEEKTGDTSAASEAKDTSGNTPSSKTADTASTSKPAETPKKDDKKPDSREAAVAEIQAEVKKLCKTNDPALIKFSNDLGKITQLDETKFKTLVDSLPPKDGVKESAEDKARKDALITLFKKHKDKLSDRPEVDVMRATSAELLACFRPKPEEKEKEKKTETIDPKVKEALDKAQAKNKDNDKDEALKKALQDKIAQLEKDQKAALDKLGQDAKNLADQAKNAALKDLGKNAGDAGNNAGQGQGEGQGQGSGEGQGQGNEGNGDGNNNNAKNDTASGNKADANKQPDLSKLGGNDSKPADSGKKDDDKSNFSLSERKKPEAKTWEKKKDVADGSAKDASDVKGLGNDVADPAAGNQWKKPDPGPSRALGAIPDSAKDPSARMGGYDSGGGGGGGAKTAGGSGGGGGAAGLDGGVFNVGARQSPPPSTVGAFNYIKTGPGDWLAANGGGGDSYGNMAEEGEGEGGTPAPKRSASASGQILSLAQGSSSSSGGPVEAQGLMKQIGTIKDFCNGPQARDIGICHRALKGGKAKSALVTAASAGI